MTTPVMVRLDNELMEQLKGWAARHDRKVADAARALIRQALQALNGDAEPTHTAVLPKGTVFEPVVSAPRSERLTVARAARVQAETKTTRQPVTRHPVDDPTDPPKECVLCTDPLDGCRWPEEPCAHSCHPKR